MMSRKDKKYLQQIQGFLIGRDVSKRVTSDSLLDESLRKSVLLLNKARREENSLEILYFEERILKILDIYQWDLTFTLGKDAPRDYDEVWERIKHKF